MSQFTKIPNPEKKNLKVSIFGSRAFLLVDDTSIEISDYKISSSMQGSTELEIKISVSDVEFSEFELEAKKESLMPQSLKSTSYTP